MNPSTNSTNQRSPVTSGLLLLAIATALVTLALTASDSYRTGSILALGFMIPIVAVGVAVTARSRSKDRISLLEQALEAERASKQATERHLARFTDELRAPMLAASGLARRLNLAGDEESDDPEESLDALSRDAVEIVRMTGNLAAAAQIDMGTYRPRPSVVALDQQAERVVEMLRHGSVEISVDTSPTSIWGDPMTVRIALLDILHAATDDGATTARIDVAERNGIGILSITDDRRRRQPTREKTDGVLDTADSLSRTIVPALVESQGGTVTATQTLGWSTTVIRLPVATPAQLAGSTANPAAASIGGPARSS